MGSIAKTKKLSQNELDSTMHSHGFMTQNVEQ
jgi:hypothetical protein